MSAAKSSEADKTLQPGFGQSRSVDPSFDAVGLRPGFSFIRAHPKCEIALVLRANFPYMGSATDAACRRSGGACEPPCSTSAANPDDHRWRTAIGQDPSRRKFSGGGMEHPCMPAEADSRILQFCADRRCMWRV